MSNKCLFFFISKLNYLDLSFNVTLGNCHTDWDLGVCLQYECKRKQLHKPDVLNSWIDLRSTYRVRIHLLCIHVFLLSCFLTHANC